MTVETKGTGKLFRMTTKRKIMMEGIITTVNRSISNVDKDSFARSLLEINKSISEEERQIRNLEMDKKWDKYCLLHDVLETVINHGSDFWLNLHMKVDRGWKNELDVPLSVFNQSIEEVIEIIKELQEKFGDRPYGGKYQEQIDFLLLVKDHRNHQK